MASGNTRNAEESCHKLKDLMWDCTLMSLIPERRALPQTLPPDRQGHKLCGQRLKPTQQAQRDPPLHSCNMGPPGASEVKDAVHWP